MSTGTAITMDQGAGAGSYNDDTTTASASLPDGNTTSAANGSNLVAGIEAGVNTIWTDAVQQPVSAAFTAVTNAGANIQADVQQGLNLLAGVNTTAQSTLSAIETTEIILGIIVVLIIIYLLIHPGILGAIL